MVEFPVELSLITLSKPKTRGKNVGLGLNLGLKKHFKKGPKIVLPYLPHPKSDAEIRG